MCFARAWRVREGYLRTRFSWFRGLVASEKASWLRVGRQMVKRVFGITRNRLRAAALCAPPPDA